MSRPRVEASPLQSPEQVYCPPAHLQPDLSRRLSRPPFLCKRWVLENRRRSGFCCRRREDCSSRLAVWRIESWRRVRRSILCWGGHVSLTHCGVYIDQGDQAITKDEGNAQLKWGGFHRERTNLEYSTPANLDPLVLHAERHFSTVISSGKASGSPELSALTPPVPGTSVVSL